jgi:hypothetical protein
MDIVVCFHPPNMGSKIPWFVPTYERPWHDQPTITKSTNPILSKSHVPNNVMLFGKEHW